MYGLVQRYPVAFLVVMITLLALGAWELSRLMGIGVMGYMIAFAIALGFILIYWATYGRSAGSPLRAAGPLLAIALGAAPFHLMGVGGATSAMLFYMLLPGAGMVLALWQISRRGSPGG